MSLDHKAQGYDLHDAIGKAGGDPDAPDLVSEAAFRLRQARAFAKLHAPELLIDPDVYALDAWRAESNLHRLWEMGCPFEGEECVLTDTREGSERRFRGQTPEAARRAAAHWARGQLKGAPDFDWCQCGLRLDEPNHDH